MTLTQQSVFAEINVNERGFISVRREDRVLRDDVVIASTNHRHVLAPGDSLEGQDEAVVRVAQAAWTPEIVAAYQALIASQA